MGEWEGELATDLQQLGQQQQRGGLTLRGGGLHGPPGPQAVPAGQYLLHQPAALAPPDGALPEGMVQHAVEQDADLEHTARPEHTATQRRPQNTDLCPGRAGRNHRQPVRMDS